MIGVAPGTAVAPTWRADRPLPSVEVHPDRVEEAFRAVAADLTALADRARAEGRQAAAEIVATGALIATDPGLVAAARRATTADGIHEAVEGYARILDALPEPTLRERAAAAIASAVRSASSARLASPVSASRVASCSMRASASLRAVTSAAMPR